MKKYTILIIAAAILFAYHYQYALWLLRLPDGTILFNDFSLLTYTGTAARNFHAGGGVMWGYDPNFMAGYPLTFIWNSNVATQLACVLLRGARADTVVRMFLFTSLMMFPLFFYWTLRNFGQRRSESLAGTVIGLLVFRMGTTMMFHITGMVTAGMITYFGLFLFSLLYRYMRDQDMRSALLLVIFSPLGLLIHKTVVVILFVPVIVLLAQHARRLRLFSWLTLTAAAAATLAANWFWLAPAFHFMKYKTFLTEAPFWQNRNLLQPFKDYFTLTVTMNNVELPGRWWYGITHTAMLWALLIFGVMGLALWRRQGREEWRREKGEGRRESHELFILISITTGFLFIFCYYGAFIRAFAELNPTRYLPVMHLLLVMPATAALLELYRRIHSRLLGGALFLGVALAGCMVSFYHLQRFDPLLQLRLGTPQTREVTDLAKALRQLPTDGRVLLEDSGVMDREQGGQIYAYSQLPALFPELTGKSFIGGPYPYLFLKFHHTDFHDGKIFGRELEDVPLARMKQYLNLYDITHVAAWSSRAENYFSAYPALFTSVKTIGRFRLYAVPRRPDKFIKGSGEVKATYNRINVYNIIPEDGEIILKYHWIDTMRTIPPRRIGPARRMDDPIGFIRIKNPPDTLTIVNP